MFHPQYHHVFGPADLAPIPLLDHGYLQLIDAWGSDAQIIEAARMSTNKGFNGWGTPDAPGDERLLAYLWQHRHHTPFEMAGLTIEVKAPIFVFRQWHRPRTQGYNEMSARYTPLPDEDYMPSLARLLADGGTNRQAGPVKDAPQLTPVQARQYLALLEVHYARGQEIYQAALDMGIPKELARIHLPVARYTRMRATANLRNWLHFLGLRADSHAQHEIQVYAKALGSIVAKVFPRTWALFEEGRQAA